MKAGPPVSLIAATVMGLMTQTQLSAATIQLLDLTESPTALAGDRPPFMKIDTCISESSCFVGLPDFLQDASGGFRAQFALTEPAKSDSSAGSLSDVIQFSVAATSPKELDVFLFSDPIPANIAGLTFYGMTDEIGSLQMIPLPKNLPKLMTGSALLVEVASDVPEPATLVLFATGLLGLGVALRSRVRRRVE